MANGTVGIGLTIGAVAQGSVGSVLTSTRRSLDGLTRSSRALELAQIRTARNTRLGLSDQQTRYDRLGRALGRVRTAHDQLTVAAARSNAAIASGQQSWGKLAGTAMAAWGTVKGAVATAGQAASFADTLRDTRIKARLSENQESALGDAIRVNVATTNQSRDDLALGAHQLITGGAGFEEAKSQIGLMGDTMTALRTSSQETTGAMLALRDMGAMDRDSMQSGIERLIAIGERGQFTPDMMIRAFAQLGDTIKTTGLKGDTAIAELAAGLQVAETSMGAANAQAGLQSWLSGLNDPKVAAAYERAGVDYKTSMAELQKSGMSHYQASLELAGAFMRDNLAAADQQALLKGDDDGRISTMLAEMGLTDVFKDANAARFALAVNTNQAAYKDMTGATGDGSLAALAELRRESPVEQMKALKNSVSALAVDIGNALLPSLLGVVNMLTPMIAGIAAFVRAHPGVVSAMAAIVSGIVAWRVASVAGVFAFRQVKIVVTQGIKAFHLLRAGLALAQAKMALFRASTLLARSSLLTKLGAVRTLAGTLMGRLTPGLRTATAAAMGFGRSLLTGARAALTTAASRAGMLARTLGGSLLTGLRVAGRAVLWLGRALLMNPIGIAVTAIAGAAFLLIKYWEPVSGFFKRVGSAVTGVFTGMWARIKDAFNDGIVGVSKLILDWSPLGLFYKAFAGVLGWFGVELPDNFSEFGGKIINAFASGIAGVFDSAWQGVTGLFDTAWKGLTNIASGALDGIVRVIGSAWQGIANVTSTAWNGITGTAESVWGGLMGFFGSVWDGAKTAFDGGIAGIAKQIADFSPLALFRKTFTGVMNWFDTELPEDFKASGKAMMDGLVGGITNMAGSVRDSIVGVSDAVVGWFRDKLGINSPSRVFMTLGANISEGAAQGISSAQGLVKKAALGMAAATAVTLATPVVATPVLPEVPPVPVALIQSGRAGAEGRDERIVIHFSPTINVQGSAGVPGIEQALDKASDDLVRRVERILDARENRKRRLDYGNIGSARSGLRGSL